MSLDQILSKFGKFSGQSMQFSGGGVPNAAGYNEADLRNDIRSGGFDADVSALSSGNAAGYMQFWLNVKNVTDVDGFNTAIDNRIAYLFQPGYTLNIDSVTNDDVPQNNTGAVNDPYHNNPQPSKAGQTETDSTFVTYYSVEGDTFASIGAKFGVTVDALDALNPEVNWALPIGYPVIIPRPVVAGSATATVTSPKSGVSTVVPAQAAKAAQNKNTQQKVDSFFFGKDGKFSTTGIVIVVMAGVLLIGGTALGSGGGRR